MVMDRRIGNQAPDYYRREESTIRLDTGPYVGKVKNNLDPTRSGRLQVYIPDLASGAEDNSEFWRTVSYASPFLGSTNQPDTNEQNAYSKVKHTYGMWMVPPDIGNLVICIFIAGDPNRGFWFACIPNQLGHHMLPGLAGSSNVDSTTIENTRVKNNYDNKPTVVSEFNENNKELDWANFVNAKKPIHEEQYKVLLNQGLEQDYIRGIISSSSQRETPSTVFGISTPGRPIKDTAQNPEASKKIANGEINENDYSVAARKGGHTLVMDDGNFQDKDRLIRLRTAGGHQILMNDSESILYIGNNTGSVWIELTGPGHLNIYTGNSVNIRAEGDLNFHADRNIHLNAGADIVMSAGKSWKQQSQIAELNTTDSITMFAGAALNLGGSGSVNINSSGSTNVLGGGGVNVSGSKIKLNDGYSGTAGFSRPSPLKFNKLSDTGKQGDRWVSVDSSLQTIVPIAPTHEPWSLHQPTSLATLTSATGVSAEAGNETPIGEPNGVTTGDPPSKELPDIECKDTPSTDPGPKSAQGSGVKNPVNKSYLFRNDNPSLNEGVGPLSPDQTRALITQVGWSESSYNYRAENRLSYIGKYQTGAAALVDLGYIKRDAYQLYGNRAVNYTTSWTGKDGISSKEEYLNNGGVQEKVMIALLKMNYKTLQRIGAIKDSDDQCTVAGMLAVAHLIGAGGAKQWRLTGGGADANGTTGATYFNMGRYAVDVLATATA
jgi:hypothetical protein